MDMIEYFNWTHMYLLQDDLIYLRIFGIVKSVDN